MSLAVLQGANLVARFALELSALAALALWGFSLDVPVAIRVLAGLGAPLVAAAVWGLFASPKAAVTVDAPAQQAVQVLLFAVAIAALAQAGRPQLAWAFGTAAAVNAALLVWWQQ